MNDSVDLNPAMIHLVEKVQADRLALQHLLTADPHAFAEQSRLLGDFQSAVRSIDILQASVAAPAAQPQIEQRSPVQRAMAAVDAELSMEAPAP